MASQHVGPVPFLTEGRDWINAGLRNLGSTLRLAATPVVVVAEADTWYTAPAGFLRIREVYDENGDRYKDWQTDIGRYRFEHDGTYTVHYYESAMPVVAETETPEGDVLFHDALVLFVCDQKQPGVGWDVRYQACLAGIAGELHPLMGRRIKARPWL